MCNDVEHIVIGGDLNTDLSRVHSGHTEYLRNILERESMKCVKFHDRCDIDYIFIHTISKHLNIQIIINSISKY